MNVLFSNERGCLVPTKQLHTAFVNSIKLSRYKMGIKVDNVSCRIKQLLDQNCKCSNCL